MFRGKNYQRLWSQDTKKQSQELAPITVLLTRCCFGTHLGQNSQQRETRKENRRHEPLHNSIDAIKCVEHNDHNDSQEGDGAIESGEAAPVPARVAQQLLDTCSPNGAATKGRVLLYLVETSR